MAPHATPSTTRDARVAEEETRTRLNSRAPTIFLIELWNRVQLEKQQSIDKLHYFLTVHCRTMFFRRTI